MPKIILNPSPQFLEFLERLVPQAGNHARHGGQKAGRGRRRGIEAEVVFCHEPHRMMGVVMMLLMMMMMMIRKGISGQMSGRGVTRGRGG